MKQEKTGRKILVRPRNSLALTSLSWESLKESTPSQFEDYFNVFKINAQSGYIERLLAYF